MSRILFVMMIQYFPIIPYFILFLLIGFIRILSRMEIKRKKKEKKYKKLFRTQFLRCIKNRKITLKTNTDDYLSHLPVEILCQILLNLRSKLTSFVTNIDQHVANQYSSNRHCNSIPLFFSRLIDPSNQLWKSIYYSITGSRLPYIIKFNYEKYYPWDKGYYILDDTPDNSQTYLSNILPDGPFRKCLFDDIQKPKLPRENRNYLMFSTNFRKKCIRYSYWMKLTREEYECSARPIDTILNGAFKIFRVRNNILSDEISMINQLLYSPEINNKNYDRNDRDYDQNDDESEINRFSVVYDEFNKLEERDYIRNNIRIIVSMILQSPHSLHVEEIRDKWNLFCAAANNNDIPMVDLFLRAQYINISALILTNLYILKDIVLKNYLRMTEHILDYMFRENQSYLVNLDSLVGTKFSRGHDYVTLNHGKNVIQQMKPVILSLIKISNEYQYFQMSKLLEQYVYA